MGWPCATGSQAGNCTLSGYFCPPPPMVPTARVYGYGLTFGLASGHQEVAQREAIKVFGAGVKVMSTRHF